MVSEDKLIRQGIRKTDAWFNKFKKQIERDLTLCNTYEEFVERTKGYTTNNILVTSGYSDEMSRLVTQIVNNHKFKRASQRALLEQTINNNVGMLIQNVGEDIKETVRTVVKQGYDEGLHPNEIAKNISGEIDKINNTRARTIARTEVKRTDTVSNYVRHKEQGAVGFTVQCRPDCCPYCAEEYGDVDPDEQQGVLDTIEQMKEDDVDDPLVRGKGETIGGNVQFSMDDTDMLPPLHPNCFDRDTQVFTNHGWKYFYDITVDDKILSLNPETNETGFLDYVKLIRVPNVHGKLYHIHNKWFDICVTPDHDCFIHQRVDRGKKGRLLEPQFRKPSDLTSESRFVRCIDTDRENPKTININGLELEPKDYAFFMAWFLSEGSILHNPETAKAHAYPIKITQEIGENREIIQPVLQRICDKLGLRLAIGKSYFEFYSKEFYDYLEPLGYSHEKYIPSEVFLLDKECLNIFLDNYVLGDGHERKPNKFNSCERAVFTSSERLRDGLSYLILLCGYYPSIAIHTPKGKVTKHKNGEYVQKNNVYRITINNSKYATYSGCTVDEIHYTDMVYCVELPKYHTLWIKRNGKTSWNGNCRCTAMFFYE